MRDLTGAKIVTIAVWASIALFACEQNQPKSYPLKQQQVDVTNSWENFKDAMEERYDRVKAEIATSKAKMTEKSEETAKQIEMDLAEVRAELDQMKESASQSWEKTEAELDRKLSKLEEKVDQLTY